MLQAGSRPIDVTIATGVVTIPATAGPVVCLRVAVESGDADDLVTINGGTHGQIVIITCPLGATKPVSITGDGNILMSAPPNVYATSSDVFVAIWTGTKWMEIAWKVMLT